MYKLLLCWRYLRTRYIALASIVSVMLGVATMIVVNAVMAGFGEQMRERIHGILADVVVETNSLDGVEDAERHMRLAREAAGEYIAAITPTVEVYGMLSFQYAGQWINRPVTLIGIDPQGKAAVGPLIESLDSYQTVRDGDRVRPPLRSPTEPPGWELTEEARRYRERWVRRQQEYRRLRRAIGNEDGAGLVSPFDRPPQGTEKSAESDQAPAAVRSGEAETPPFAGESVSFPGDSASPVAAADPFAAPPVADGRPGSAGRAAADESRVEPFEARLYVGAGLIEFPFEDPTTGAVRTIRMVRPGDDVILTTVKASRPPEGTHFNATVVDVFRSGMSEYDSSLVFCNIEYLQKVRGMVDPSTGRRAFTALQIRLKDYRHAEEVVRRLRAVFPPEQFTVKTWEQKQGPLLAAVEVESAILNVLLFLIIAVAGFGILAIFFMIVVEKTRDIGILKALGAGSRGVMAIFLSYGLGLGVVGSGVGVVIGLLFVRYINEIEAVLTFLTGRKVFDERIYYFPEIPTNVQPWTVVWIAAGAMLIAVLASILPARRAARLHPVEALRYE
ncbi:MAG: ABC transporter permease [Planctomycetota bacterium]|nr:MAG: ABC transporter permease [Planctomycetota bacterium]